jgi:hypothetical protein
MQRAGIWTTVSVILTAAVAAACGEAKPETESAACNVAATGAAAAEAEKAGCGKAWIDANVRINQLQSFGTHNSYKLAIPPNELALIAEMNPDAAITLDYAHDSIAEQLRRGARQLEIDPTDDPEGGVYTDPLAPRLLAQRGETAEAYDSSVMAQPGIKVIHAPDIDYRSSCPLFADCLRQVKTWSDANPDHTPILIMINPKSSGISWPGAAPVRPWDGESYNRMDAEILSVFPREQIITPDEVRGGRATLREAVTDGGWPVLAQARGRVIFAIDLSPAATAPYAEGRPSLEGRLAFINTAPDAPEAAYFTMNDPVSQQDLIRERVAQGFLIRTRADADTREARTGETARRDAALASGAQFISTDYQAPDERFGTGYSAALPDSAASRCNPVNAPAGCDRAAE